VKTDSFDEFQNAKNYGYFSRTPQGTYELHFPTKLNKELKTLTDKDFDLDVFREGENLKVILTDKASQKRIDLIIAPCEMKI